MKYLNKLEIGPNSPDKAVQMHSEELLAAMDQKRPHTKLYPFNLQITVFKDKLPKEE